MSTIGSLQLMAGNRVFRVAEDRTDRKGYWSARLIQETHWPLKTHWGGDTAGGRRIGWEDTPGKGMMENNHVIDERQNQLARHLPAGKTEHHTTGHCALCMIMFRHMQATQSYQANCNWHSEPWWASSPGQRRFVGHLLSANSCSSVAIREVKMVQISHGKRAGSHPGPLGMGVITGGLLSVCARSHELGRVGNKYDWRSRQKEFVRILFVVIVLPNFSQLFRIYY